MAIKIIKRKHYDANLLKICLSTQTLNVLPQITHYLLQKYYLNARNFKFENTDKLIVMFNELNEFMNFVFDTDAWRIKIIPEKDKKYRWFYVVSSFITSEKYEYIFGKAGLRLFVRGCQNGRIVQFFTTQNNMEPLDKLLDIKSFFAKCD